MTETPRLTVVIPTKDRWDKLSETLNALASLDDAVPFEVVVVDDGSRDQTVEKLNAERPLRPFTLRVFNNPGRGPAAARNQGAREARAETVLFLGDDTRPTPGTLNAHLTASENGRFAVQGHIDWDPDREITPLMRFLAPEGPQFYFRGLVPGRTIPFTSVLGSNFSAPKAWLLEDPFDERFPHAAVEDTELAWRWYRKGRKAVYCPQALCLHHHRYDELDTFLERQRRAGASARYAVAEHPSLLWRLVLHPTLFTAWIAVRRLLGRGRPNDDWDLACRWAFFKGYLRGG